MSKEPNIATAEIDYGLLSQITHDVRGPFNGLIGFSDLLLSTQNAENRDAYSLTVFQLANKSYLFLQVLMVWVKLISKNYEANTTIVSSDDIISQALKFNESEIIGKNIQTHIEIKDQSIQADQTYLPVAIGIIVHQMARLATTDDEIVIMSDDQKCEISFVGINEYLTNIFSEAKSNFTIYTEKTYLLWIANQIISNQQFIHSPNITIVPNNITYSFHWA